jgi:hypothetical protein
VKNPPSALLPGDFNHLFIDPEEESDHPRAFPCCGVSVEVFPAGEGTAGVRVPPWVLELILTLRTVSDDFTALLDEYDPAPHALHALLRYLSPRPAARAALLSTARIDPRAGEWLLQETWPHTGATLCRASRR